MVKLERNGTPPTGDVGQSSCCAALAMALVLVYTRYHPAIQLLYDYN